MNQININGKIKAESESHISTDNGAFRHGYGLFETMLVKEGEIRLKNGHLERLFSGAHALGLHLPALLNKAKLEEEILHIVHKNNHKHLARVRVQVYAGGGGLFSHDNKAGYVIECFPLTPEIIALNEQGLVAGIAPGITKSCDSLANIKSCSALLYAMAAKHAVAAKWNDALIRNVHGRVIESSIANIFWVNDGTLYTPPLTEGCIAGVMRQHICDNNRVTEKPLNIEELHNASEVFLTNAVRGIKWISSIGQHQYSCNMAAKISKELP